MALGHLLPQGGTGGVDGAVRERDLETSGAPYRHPNLRETGGRMGPPLRFERTTLITGSAPLIRLALLGTFP